MQKTFIFIGIVLLFTSCNNSSSSDNTDLDEFIDQLDNKSLEEIKEEMNNNVAQFEQFTNFFEGSFKNEIKKINKEDERYEPEFKIDTNGVGKALDQFNFLAFSQSYENYQSLLQFVKQGSEDSKPIELGEGVSQTFIPKKIYYHDGSTRTDSIANLGLDFTFNEAWGAAKPIDSIDINYKVNYLKDYDVVEISVDKPKIRYKGGDIKFVKAKDNYLYLTFSDTITDPIKIQGYNADGEVLSRSGYSNNSVAPDESKAVFTEMLSYFKKLQKKLNDGDFKSTAEFQSYLKDHLSGLSYFNDNDGLYHKEYYFYGNVKSVKIYFEKDSESREVNFTARNLKSSYEDDELFNMATDDGVVFCNSKGQQEIKITNSENEIEKIGGAFYQDYNNFYFLNRAEKRLDTLLVYNVVAFDNGLVGIQPEQEYDDYTLFSNDNKQVGTKKYSDLRELGTTLFGFRNDKIFILDNKGNETAVSGVTKIYDVESNDRIMASNVNKIGFINTIGKIVIPFKFDDAKDFEDGMTAVKFNGTYKIIDMNGKVIVETDEDDISFFEKDADGKRIYRFDYGNKSYNFKGELISE